MLRKITKKLRKPFVTLGVAIISFYYIPLAIAGQLRDGTIFFDRPPRLLDAFTYSSDANVWGARYYFVVELPENAGEPLKKVVIQQRVGQERIRFFLQRTSAFLGTPDRRKSNLNIAEVTQNEETRSITVIFDSPVSPGSIFTVALRPRRNPRFGGIYLFGVEVFPAGEKSSGLYLGPGRFHFYQGDRFKFHRYRFYP